MSKSADSFVKNLIDMVETNTAPWQREWQPGFTAPYNPHTGNRYTGCNFLSLLMYSHSHGFDDPRWMTRHEIARLGYRCKPDAIEAPVVFFKKIIKTEKSDEIDTETGEVKNEIQTIPICKNYLVINASQIIGIPVLEKSYPDLTINDQKMEVLVAQAEPHIIHIEMQSNDAPCYMPFSDTIKLPLKKQYRSASGYYRTVCHELAHSTGHASRLARDLSGSFGSPEYAREELRAEIASLLLCMTLGVGFSLEDLSHQKAQASAYLKNWLSDITDQKQRQKELESAIKDARIISEYLLKDHEKELGLIHSPDDRLTPSMNNSFNGMSIYQAKKSQKYIGKILGIDEQKGIIYQHRYGKIYLIEHEICRLNRIPDNHEFVCISYDSSGKGIVEIYQKGKGNEK